MRGRSGPYGSYAPRGMGTQVKVGTFTPPSTFAIADFIDRDQDRALRAKTWKHLRQINPQVARRVWTLKRRREKLEAQCPPFLIPAPAPPTSPLAMRKEE